MKKLSHIGLTIGIVISIFFTLVISFFLAPLFLSLTHFGLQDPEFPPNLVARHNNEVTFYFIFGGIYLLVLIIMLITNIKISRIKHNLNKAKLWTITISIISTILICVYGIGTFIIHRTNNNHINWISFLIALLPALLYLVITTYFALTILLSIANNDLKEIEENTI